MPIDSTALVQPIRAIEASTQERTETDRTFLNWFLYFFLLSWITFGIASIYYYVRRFSRVDQYSRRKQAYYAAVVDYSERYAQATEKNASSEIGELRSFLARAAAHDLKPIGALLTVLLTLVTFGLYAIIGIYQLNRAWVDRQRAEAEFDDLLSKAWLQLGVSRYPVTFDPVPGKDRSFALYLLLTIVTLGIWGLVWDYKIHTDPDSIFPRLHQVEDTVVQLARSAGA
jgi:Domain of unknown function (DUF4234)